MAQTTQKTKKPAEAPSRATPENAILKLQKAVNRATTAIMDGKLTSMAASAAMCARRGVPQSTVTLAVDAAEEAIADLKEAVTRAYAAPAPKPARISRVNLLEA